MTLKTKGGIIYVGTNIQTGRKYIGQHQCASSKAERSFTAYCRRRAYCAIHEYKNSLIHRMIRRYGAEAFIWEIIGYYETFHEMNAAEKHFIEKYNTLSPNGYNETRGGMGSIAYRHTEEARARMSEDKKAKYQGYVPQVAIDSSTLLTFNGETLSVNSWNRKLGLGQGVIHWRITNGWSVERALSEPSGGEEITFNGETRTVAEWAKAIGIAETSLRRRLKKDWPLEKALSSSTYRYSRPVICLTTNERFSSAKEAGLSKDLHAQNIGMVCLGKKQTCGGLRWAFVDD